HAIVRVDLATGRKHQIRVQMAKIGHPILGDQKYGSNKPFPAGIGLHAERLSFEHPVRREPVELIAPLPRSWRGFAGGRDRLA
ncbi:MAG: RNA pseudouridine synthase, partial [Planctomycetota bacterium]